MRASHVTQPALKTWKGRAMPTKKVKGGYRWGSTGKVYPTKKQADKQGAAIHASGWKEGGSGRKSRSGSRKSH